MSETLWPVFLILLGLVLLYLGGEGLVRGSSSLALRFGMTPLVVGLTVVALGTSAPEMVVSVKAALAGQGDIAIGNVIGSNSLNIGLILGLTALIYPLKVQLQILRIDAPIMVGVSLLAAWMLADLKVSRVEGALLVTGLFIYTISTVLMATRWKTAPAVTAEFSESLPAPRGSKWRDLLFILGGLVLLVAGSRAMVDGAVMLARSYGISEAIIGLTIVSMGTSMPELTACLIAALKKEPDIALGNIVGSNIFNILGILGTAALAQPMVGTGIKMTDVYVALVFAALLLPMMGSGFTLHRWKGVLLIGGYLGYLAWLWPK